MLKWFLSILSFWMSVTVTPQKIMRFLETRKEGGRDNLAFVTPETVRVSCVQLEPRPYKNLKAYLSDMLTLVESAVEAGAHLVVFPEYTGLLPASLIPFSKSLLRWASGGEKNFRSGLTALDGARAAALAEAFHHFFYEAYLYTFSTIARRQHVYIVAGTCLFYEQGKLYNRCVVFGPDGEPAGVQDKTSSIGFDRALGVAPSSQIEVIPTPMGDLGIVIGSDAYYFECFKIAKAKGACLFAVPGCAQGAFPGLLRCRADENNSYVVYSCMSHGQQQSARAGIFAPFRVCARRDGIIAQAPQDGSCTVASRINLQKLENAPVETEPNPAFLAGDYLRSYRYCGRLPIIDPEGLSRD